MKIELSDLAKIKGIGQKTLERVKKQINYKEELKKDRDVSLQVDKIETNIIHNMDNIKGLRTLIPDNSIDLTITSPPYDNIREYEQFDFNFKAVAKELYRITKDGGIVVWIVNDATIDGSESGTSFKQALYFKEIGFNLHDTMIYAKKNPLPLNDNRYEPQFEYMFIFTIGQPKTFNPIKIKSKLAGKINSGTYREKNGTLSEKNGSGLKIKKYKVKNNIWFYGVGSNSSSKDKIAFEHPAIFPEKLVKDHIKSWSNKGDIVLDPFMGSGTTAKMAKKLNRKYVGFEVSEKYCDIAKQRLGGE